MAYKPVIHTITYNGCRIAVLRLDLPDSEVSGNKWFKLKYNLQAAAEQGKDTILTFGGAYSNHIAATAAACKKLGLKSVGIIRGDAGTRNATLQKAKEHGMELRFVSREAYREKNNAAFLDELQGQYPGAYIIPEGGDNALGMAGCREILAPETAGYRTICCAIGTGTTFKGLRQALLPHQSLIGIPVLKGFPRIGEPQAETFTEYHFGGYARHTPELLAFKQRFESIYDIPLDYVYTAKLFYAVCNLCDRQVLGNEHQILVIHSGGLQGNEGYEARYNLNPRRQLTDAQG